MDVLIVPTLMLLKSICSFASWVIIIDIVVNWLIIANILSTQNQIFTSLIYSIGRMADFMLTPIRKRLPMIGQFDFSPIVFIFFLNFVDAAINRLIVKF